MEYPAALVSVLLGYCIRVNGPSHPFRSARTLTSLSGRVLLGIATFHQSRWRDVAELRISIINLARLVILDNTRSSADARAILS